MTDTRKELLARLDAELAGMHDDWADDLFGTTLDRLEKLLRDCAEALRTECKP